MTRWWTKDWQDDRLWNVVGVECIMDEVINWIKWLVAWNQRIDDVQCTNKFNKFQNALRRLIINYGHWS